MKLTQKTVALFSVLLLGLPIYVFAEGNSDILSHYQYVSSVPQTTVPVPTKVELEIPNASMSQFEKPVVYEKNADRFIRATLITPQKVSDNPTISVSRNSGTKTASLLDGDSNTFYTVEAYPDGVQRGDKWISTITISWASPITASKAVFAIDETGITPSQVMVSADTGVVASWQPYTGTDILFNSQVTSRHFQISFEHTGDVRISEVSIPHTTTSELTRISFLMQPNETYEIYSNPIDTTNVYSYTQSSSYSNTQGTFLGRVSPQKNTLFWSGDLDGDGLPASNDNCLEYANQDQLDENQNGIGDACEDFDQDGVKAAIDNCPDYPNANQRDTDGDGIGDECDPEESRLTEQYKWVPLVGIVVAGGVLVALFASVMLAARKFKEEEIVETKTREGQE